MLNILKGKYNEDVFWTHLLLQIQVCHLASANQVPILYYFNFDYYFEHLVSVLSDPALFCMSSEDIFLCTAVNWSSVWLFHKWVVEDFVYFSRHFWEAEGNCGEFLKQCVWIKCLCGSGPNLTQSSSDQLAGPGKACSKKGEITLCGNGKSWEQLLGKAWIGIPLHPGVNIWPSDTYDSPSMGSWGSSVFTDLKKRNLRKQNPQHKHVKLAKNIVCFVLHIYIFLHCVYITVSHNESFSDL